MKGTFGEIGKAIEILVKATFYQTA